jgi:hypothetical protein
MWTAILQYWNTKFPLYFELTSADPIGTIVSCAALRSWVLSCFLWHDRDILCVYTSYHLFFSANYLFSPPSLLPLPMTVCMSIRFLDVWTSKRVGHFFSLKFLFHVAFLIFKITFWRTANILAFAIIMLFLCVCVCACVWVGNSCTNLFVSSLYLGKELSYALRSC